MTECYCGCGEDAGYSYRYIRGKPSPSSKTPRKFINREHQRKYRMATFQRGNLSNITYNFDRIFNTDRQKLIEKARHGNKTAQQILKKTIGLTGLWNPQKQEMIKF